MKKILLITGVIVFVTALALIAEFVYLLNGYQNTKTRVSESVTDMSQFHSKNGYTISYPKNWTVDESKKTAPAEFIREPNGRAFFSMQTHQDFRVTKPAEMPQVHRDVEESFKNDPAYLVEWSEWEKDDVATAENSYFVSGSYAETGKHWRFKELNIFTKSGIILTLRGMVLKDYSNDFGPILDKIIFSVQPGNQKNIGVSQTEALFKVKSQSEVVKYVADLKKAGSKASFETQDNDDEWSVQVFEIVKNEGEVSHTATFGWYLINKNTGQITRDL